MLSPLLSFLTNRTEVDKNKNKPWIQVKQPAMNGVQE